MKENEKRMEWRHERSGEQRVRKTLARGNDSEGMSTWYRNSPRNG